MATPPTRVSYNTPTSGNYSTSTTPKTTNTFDVQAGDLIVVLASAEHGGASLSTNPTASGGSVTWTARWNTAGTSTSGSRATCWTGVVGATATGITVSVSRGGTALFWGFSATLWRNHGGVGATANEVLTTGSEAPAVDITTTGANSAVQYTCNDWNAVDGTSRTWRSINVSATESLYFRSAANHTVYGAYWSDTGTAGTKTMGLTAPTGQRPAHGGIEILGTTSGTTHALASTGTGTSTGSLAVSLVQKTSSTGTGTSTGSVNVLLAPGAISATGTGTTTGSANVNLAPGALSATGTGQTGGSAGLSLNAALTASGTGQTAGSVDVTLDAAPLALSATGTGTTTGSAALQLQATVSATGTGTSTGSVALDIVGGPLSLSATGTGQTSGSLAMTATLTASSTGTGSSAGSVNLIETLRVSATGTGATTGTAAITVRHGVSATGTSQTAGSLDVTIPFGNTYALSAIGTGTSSGSLELTPLLAISAAGAGQTDGSLVLIRTGQLRAMGLGGQTSGSLVLNLRCKLTASGSAQTEGSLELRISTHQLTATGYSFSTGSLDLTEPLFRFSMPTHEEPMRVDPDRRNAPLGYYRLTYAPSLVKVGGTWTAMRTPPPELLEGLTAGEDYFLGGFDYEISQQLARELALAGYTATPI